MKAKSNLRSLLLAAGSSMLAISSASGQATSATWDENNAGNWTAVANWVGNTAYAEGADNTATFGNFINADRIVTLNAGITIGNIIASDTSNNYTISGANILTLDLTAGIPSIDVTTSGRTLTISSQIAGSDGLEKSGAGTLVLSRDNTTANTLTGGITLTAGTLQANTGASTSLTPGSPLGANALNLNAGTLQLRSSGTANATADTIQWNNNTTVGGNVTINVDRAGGSGSNKIHQLGTLSIGAHTLIVEDASSAQHDLRFGATTLTGNAVFDVRNNGGGSTFMNLTLGAVGESGGARSFTKSGAGTLTLSAASTYSGGTTISAGTISISADDRLGNSSGGLTFNGGNLSMGNSTISSSRNITVNDSIVGTMGSFSGGNGGAFTHNGNLLGGTTSTFVYRAANDNRLTLNGTGGFSGTLVVQGYAGARDGIVLNNASAISDSNAAIRVGVVGATSGLGFNGGFQMGTGVGSALTFNNRYIEIANNMTLANANTTSGRTLTFTKAFQVTATTNSTLNLGGVSANGVNVLSGGGISNGVGGVVTSLTVNFNHQSIGQTSNWAIGGTNTYTGNTTIVAGTLRLDSSLAMQNSALDTTSSVTGGASAGLRFNTGVTEVTLGGLIGNKNFTTGGVISTASSNYSSVTSLTLNPGTGITRNYTAVISNGASGMTVTKSGLGTQILTNTQSYTGATNINAGTLQLDGSTHASSTVAIGTAGTLTGSGTVNGNATLTGSGIINKASGTIAGTLGVTGGNWNGAGAVTGLVTSSSGTFTIGSGANLTANGGLSVTGGSLAGSGTVTGTTGVSSATVNGTGLMLTGLTTFNGTGNVLSGTVTTNASLASGAALSLTGGLTGNMTVGNGTLSGTGSVSGTTGVTGGTVNGSGLVLTGTTTFNSTGNSLTGTVTSTAGVSVAAAASLAVNGTLTGNLTTAASSTLSGTGTITGTTTIQGVHNPGNSPGIQTFGNLSYVDGGIPDPAVNWELNANTVTNVANPNAVFDQIIVGGDLDFTDITTINLIFNGSGSTVLWSDTLWDSNQSWTIYDVAGTTSNFANLNLTSINWLDSVGNSFSTTGGIFTLGQLGQDVMLNYVVPETSTALLSGLGALALLRRRRR